MKIARADLSHVDEVARLFDLYRQFYECDPDLGMATEFIRERLSNDESTIYIAIDDDNVVGFTQLYASFCSVEAVKIYILYDLYVDADGRNLGTGRALMEAAHEFAREQGAGRVDLLTAHSNKPGQHLYEKLGYEKVLEDFYAYSFAL